MKKQYSMDQCAQHLSFFKNKETVSKKKNKSDDKFVTSTCKTDTPNTHPACKQQLPVWQQPGTQSSRQYFLKHYNTDATSSASISFNLAHRDAHAQLPFLAGLSLTSLIATRHTDSLHDLCKKRNGLSVSSSVNQ